MVLIYGFLMILIAGIFQGTFILPLSYTKKWKWENAWLTYALFGMVLLNWLFAFLFIPKLPVIYEAVPSNDLFILMLFGFGCGLGAVLFGIGMDKLGNLGSIVGWPLFISISIVVGNMWGIWKGEWKESSQKAKSMLNTGLIVLVVAMVIFGISNLL